MWNSKSCCFRAQHGTQQPRGARPLDRAEANILTERQVALDRDDSGWESTKFDCEAHMIATVHEKTYGPTMDPQVSGMIHIALSCNFSSTMTKLRELVKERQWAVRIGGQVLRRMRSALMARAFSRWLVWLRSMPEQFAIAI